jgi:hypothetical protein
MKKDKSVKDKSVKVMKIVNKSKDAVNDPMANQLSKLKDFDTIRKDYDLVDEHLTTGIVLHKLSEVLEFYLKNIQQILQPEEFHALYECNAFSDADKLKLFDLYKRIIITHREILKAEIMNDEKNSLSTIQFVHEEIKAVRPQMLDIVKKMQQSWKTDPNSDMHRGPKQYFG